MIDFASVARSGYAALVGDQYIVSVAHNGDTLMLILVRKDKIPINIVLLIK